MQRLAPALVALAAVLGLVACGGTTETVRTVTEEAAVTETTTATVTVTQTETITISEAQAPEPAEEEQTAAPFPPGYPKKVPMSEVPEQMRAVLGADEGVKTAIAIADGVWTQDAPGTSVEEDALYGSHIGWCASVEAYEREYGLEAGGSCW